MTRTYQRVKPDSQWTEEVIKEAVLCVLAGEKCSRVAKRFAIPRQTLQKKVKLFKENDHIKFSQKRGSKPVFSFEQEEILIEILLEHESDLSGFTSQEVRKLAFEIAEKNNLKHNFNLEEEMAGEDWLDGFKKRHPNITLRKPEHTSAQRAEGFRPDVLQLFYDKLEKLIQDNKILPENIYNMDETPVPTVPKGTAKVFAPLGKKQVGGLVSGERGEHVTAAVCFSATGVYVPPLLIFPRKKDHPDYHRGKPEGASVEFESSGYMTSENFVKWMEKFIEFSKPSDEKKVLLILDGHPGAW